MWSSYALGYHHHKPQVGVYTHAPWAAGWIKGWVDGWMDESAMSLTSDMRTVRFPLACRSLVRKTSFSILLKPLSTPPGRYSSPDCCYRCKAVQSWVVNKAARGEVPTFHFFHELFPRSILYTKCRARPLLRGTIVNRTYGIHKNPSI